MNGIPTRRAMAGDEATVFMIAGKPVCVLSDANQAIVLKDGDQICVRGCPRALTAHEGILRQRPLSQVRTKDAGELVLEFEGLPTLHPLSVLEGEYIRVWQVALQDRYKNLHPPPDALLSE